MQKLAAALPVLLGIYLAARFAQLAIEGNTRYLFTSGRMSLLFWAEIALGVLFPLIFFSFKKMRTNPNGLLIGALAVLLGMILNQFNVSWFGLTHSDPITYIPAFMSQVGYFPSLPEVAISAGIFSAGILAFGLAVKYLPVFEEHELEQAHK